MRIMQTDADTRPRTGGEGTSEGKIPCCEGRKICLKEEKRKKSAVKNPLKSAILGGGFSVLEAAFSRLSPAGQAKQPIWGKAKSLRHSKKSGGLHFLERNFLPEHYTPHPPFFIGGVYYTLSRGKVIT